MTARPHGAKRRKNFILPQHKIDRVRRLLHVGTETEAIERALDTVIDLKAFERETDAALVSLMGEGDIVNYFDPPSVTRRAPR